MPVGRVIRNRGATVSVTAWGETLFMPGGDVYRWNQKAISLIRNRTIKAAPSNKRPRWAHYGKPLKDTIRSAKPRFFPTKAGARLYAAVGSTAPYATFVDQGTGVFAGNSPYPAKILPPYQWGGASLYEHTWRPGGPGSRLVAPVMIKGQEGQFFFAKGLADAWKALRLGRTIPAPAPMARALNSQPADLGNFVGATPVSPAFVGQLNEWRRWRDEAWERGEGLGRGGGIGSRAHERAMAVSRSKTRRPKSSAPKKAKPMRPKKAKPDKSGFATLRDKQTAAVRAFTKQNPKVKIVSRIPAGLVVVAPRDGREYVIPWTRLYGFL